SSVAGLLEPLQATPSASTKKYEAPSGAGVERGCPSPPRRIIQARRMRSRALRIADATAPGRPWQHPPRHEYGGDQGNGRDRAPTRGTALQSAQQLALQLSSYAQAPCVTLWTRHTGTATTPSRSVPAPAHTAAGTSSSELPTKTAPPPSISEGGGLPSSTTPKSRTAP